MKKNSEKLSSNMEDYLEAIALLMEKNKVARVRDISDLLGVKASSVTSALDALSKSNLVLHERYGYVQLTPAGEKLAENVVKRHKILDAFLTKILGISPKVAAEDACKMEHSISSQTFERLTKFIEFVETSPANGRPQWLQGFDYYFKTGKRQKCRIQEIKQKKKK